MNGPVFGDQSRSEQWGSGHADDLLVCETIALHSLVLSTGQSLLQNGLFQRGKVMSVVSWILHRLAVFFHFRFSRTQKGLRVSPEPFDVL
jgi:hypothetical protein